MKLRLRFLNSTKVIEIIDEEAAEITVEGVTEKVQDAFADVLFGEFELSLNNKDPLERELKVIGDYDVVSGDLIFIMPKGDVPSSSAKLQSNETHQSQNSQVRTDVKSPKLIQDSKKPACELLKSEYSNTEQQNNINIEQPGTSTGMEMKQADTNTDMESAQPGTSTGIAIETEEEPLDLAVVQKCLSEPVLCREAVDGSVPALLRELHGAMQPADVPETLCVVLHVLMLETGFTPYPEVSGPVSGPLPATWQHGGYYKFTYTYPGCSETTCCITMISTGSSLSVHGKVVGSNDATRQCTLKPSEYVCSVNADCAQCYCQLAKLSRLFKDSIANPLVHDIRTAAGLVDVFGLLALTQEVKLRILNFLDVRSLLQVSLVNTELHEITKDPYLWRNLYLKHFGNRKDNCLSQDWKELYKREYKARKERHKLMSRMTLLQPPYSVPHNHYGGTSNWIPPIPGAGGMIGGDYDLYPNFPGSLPGFPGRLGPLPPNLPRPRYDLIGPGPGVDPGPDPGLFPWRPGGGGRMGRGTGGFGGFGPRFF